MPSIVNDNSSTLLNQLRMNDNLTKRSVDQMFGPCLVAFKFRPRQDGVFSSITQEITKYKRKNAEKYSIDEEYSSKNFSEVTNPLIYGVDYDVFLIPIIGKDVTFEECLSFMKEGKYMLAGPSVYPAMLRESSILSKLPQNKWMISIDAEKHCFNSRGVKIFHCLKVYGGASKKDMEIEIQPSTCKSTFDRNYILVCFRKAE